MKVTNLGINQDICKAISDSFIPLYHPDAPINCKDNSKAIEAHKELLKKSISEYIDRLSLAYTIKEI